METVVNYGVMLTSIKLSVQRDEARRLRRAFAASDGGAHQLERGFEKRGVGLDG